MDITLTQLRRRKTLWNDSSRDLGPLRNYRRLGALTLELWRSTMAGRKEFPMPDKGPGSKGGAKKPKGGGKAASKNGKK